MESPGRLDRARRKDSMFKLDRRKKIFLITFLAAALITQLPFLSSLALDARLMIAIAFAAAAFWITEVIPIPMTALMVIILQGIFRIQPFHEGIAFVAHPVNTLLLAGFIIAGAMKKHGLDRRIGLKFISFMGEKTSRLILGVMIGTAILSMWISNTAATAIMLPIGIGILEKAKENPRGTNMGKAMVIGIAFIANIGGMGTPVGTPPVPITIGFLNDLAGINVTFGQWLVRAVPIVLILIPLVWKLMITIYEPEVKRIKGGTEEVKKELAEMGKLSTGQRHVVILFVLALGLWLVDAVGPFILPFFSSGFIDFLSPLSPLADNWMYIASLLISLIFVLPKVGAIGWREAGNEIGWGVLILVGGGLALGSGLEKTGVIELIASNMEIILMGAGLILVVAAIGFVTAFSITLFSSLTATSSTFVPVAIELASDLGHDQLLLASVAGMAACFAFLLPANTPPNALVYQSKFFKTAEMTKAGLLATVISVTALIFMAMIYWEQLPAFFT